ncbi:MAG: NAD(P)-dependent oxidoreductase [Deltaproteobacteria bacterium]|jgi:3-hydroxyisobutyrate dehydrogenase/2-hydroxy-3-oxopropionate reductase|nr:NAD(P)-dependent oxidoreductase [Deltaproteobacteria bacterium]
MKTIGFIGVGLMGKSMVRNLMKAGFELRIFARNPAKVSDVVSEGAQLYPSLVECVNSCDAVITIVGFPKDVSEVYFGDQESGVTGILDSAKPGAFLIDMTTSSPQLSLKIFKQGTQKGFKILDAPVTGGDTGAKAGTLSILVGGQKEVFQACQPLFKAMGTNINYQGPAGCGQLAKLANQIIIAGTMAGVCEALGFAKSKGLDLQTLFNSVATGAAGSTQLNIFGPKIIDGDMAPGFFIKHFIKDMTLASQEANDSNLNLDILKQVLSHYESLAAEGYAELGTQALSKYYGL